MRGRDDNRWTAVALGVLALLTVADLVLGSEVQFTGSMVVAPFIAGAMVGPARTLSIAVVCLTTVVVLGRYNDAGNTEAALRVVVVFGGSMLAVWLSARREAREQELASVTRVAEVAQRAVLTAVPAQIGTLAFASRYQSANPEALIGGDFYEVVECEWGGVRVVVGDVRGKGLDAVRLAAVVLGSFREAAQSLDRLEDVATLVDRRLRRHLEVEDFVTAVFAEFGHDGSLTVVNCGHHPPVAVRQTGIELLTPHTATTPLGLDPEPLTEQVCLAAGDRLLLYTDGLVESRSRSGRMIALDHLAETLRAPSLDDALGELLRSLQSLVIGPLEDDLALVLVEYRGPGLDQSSDETRILSITAE